MAERYIHPGAKELKPLTQGSLSRLCGLYSVLNAVQIALFVHRLDKAELQSLYNRGIAHLASRRQLKRVLGAGMGEEEWLALSTEILAYTNEKYSTSLKLRPIIHGTAQHDRHRALNAVKKAVRNGWPVLICFSGSLNHYSVVCGFSQHRLVLFDSSNLRWLQLRNVGMGEHSRRSHWITAGTTIAVLDDW
jgi:hypothetical protein